MAWLEPVTLSGDLVVLEPLRHDHHDGLVAAARDGRLWELWYTSVPAPQDVGATSTGCWPSSRPARGCRSPPGAGTPVR